jgi:hypothetical protein
LKPAPAPAVTNFDLAGFAATSSMETPARAKDDGYDAIRDPLVWRSFILPFVLFARRFVCCCVCCCCCVFCLVCVCVLFACEGEGEGEGEGGGWRVEGGGWRVEGGGWRVRVRVLFELG